MADVNEGYVAERSEEVYAYRSKGYIQWSMADRGEGDMLVGDEGTLLTGVRDRWLVCISGLCKPKAKWPPVLRPSIPQTALKCRGSGVCVCVCVCVCVNACPL